MRTNRLAVVTTLALACIAAGAHAQLDSPPPPLQGQPSFHLYSVPGVIAFGGLGTFFPCTNTTGAAIRVGVELFGPRGRRRRDRCECDVPRRRAERPGPLRYGGATGLRVS